jgi:S-adenosyl-L-methionine hydrolase (adenosine-forming)
VTCITLMTDFGNRDDSAGCCRGVIVGRAPDARLVDITHEIPPFDIRRGALTWINVLPYMPVGIHVGVVDPGVGTARRPIAVRTRRGDVLVGPDNGLLPAAAAALGGVSDAVELADERFMLQPRSNTFHGRDIFAPMAAALATGTPLGDLGPALDPATLVTLALPRPRWDGEALHCAVVYVDNFGNLRLNAGEDVVADWHLHEGDAVGVTLGGHRLSVPFARSFGMVPEGTAALIVDAYWHLMLAINRGHAAATYGVGIDAPVVLRRTGDGAKDAE